MKKLLFTLFCLFAIFTAKAQCDYTISGADTYGDSWNGGFVTISVDNVETIFTVPSTADANEVVTLSIPTYTDDAPDAENYLDDQEICDKSASPPSTPA